MTDASEQWLDEIDRAILDQLAAAHGAVDPPPAELDERVRFAIALDNIDIEVARLQDEVLIGTGARASERTRTITFDSDSRTIMVSIVERPGGLVRLDGWIAPAGRMQIELRTAGSSAPAGEASQVVTADETGRFVFDGVAHGLAQLLVHPAVDTGQPGRTVVTPPLLL